MTQTISQMKSLAHAAAEALRNAEARDVFLEPVRLARTLSGSQIENIMGEALICCAKLNGGVAPKIIPPGRPIEGEERLLIAPQMTCGFYIVDFALVDQLHDRRLVVECDGHDFHDKSATHAAHDKARDRFLMNRGWPVMRFTGTEITRQIDMCLADVVTFLTGGVK